jgi:hypothetical protein
LEHFPDHRDDPTGTQINWFGKFILDDNASVREEWVRVVYPAS